MQWIRREETRRDQSAPLPSLSGRSRIATGQRYGRRFAVFAAALIGIATDEPAMAAVCHVPAAVLCDGCVERLSIRVTPGGACRVSFTAPVSPESTGAARFVDINVEAEPPRPVRHRVGAPRLSATRPAAP